MRDFSKNHEWLSINTATVRKSRGQDLPLTDIIEACVSRGIKAISPWRDQVAAVGLNTVSKLVKTHGLKLSGYCRGGMFPAATAAGIQAADADNRQAVDEACELNAPCLVLVVGGLPGALAGQAAHKNIQQSRDQVFEGIEKLLAYAKSCNMPLAIEPLHPMYAADRACINAQDTDGNSPLLLAARYGHLAIVKALIAAKADLLVVNKAGHKASDAARQSADGASARNILKVNKKAAAETVEVLIEAEIDAMP